MDAKILSQQEIQKLLCRQLEFLAKKLLDGKAPDYIAISQEMREVAATLLKSYGVMS